MIRPKSVLSVVLLLCSSALAARVERVIDTWRPTHYLVNITLNDQLSEITSASVRIYATILKPTRAIDLDFGELKVNRVSINGKEVSFTHQNGKLLFTLAEDATPGTSLVLGVDYQGKPKDGLILTTDKDGKPAVIGDNWPDRVHHWIPTLDHPSARKPRSRSTSPRPQVRKSLRMADWTTWKPPAQVNERGPTPKVFRFRRIA
jgi:aminopeptidase N